jgi:hypothetical protein
MSDRRDRPESEPRRSAPAPRGFSVRSFRESDTPSVPADTENAAAERRVGEPDRRNHASRAALLDRFRAEFRDMPGLWVTRGDARRLFGVPEDICTRVLDRLVLEGTLIRTPGGIYHTPSRISHQRG